MKNAVIYYRNFWLLLPFPGIDKVKNTSNKNMENYNFFQWSSGKLAFGKKSRADLLIPIIQRHFKRTAQYLKLEPPVANRSGFISG